jgi:hypothetical protein
MKHLKSLLLNLAELPIILVAGLANVAWLCVKRTKIGPIIRNLYFGASARLKRNK